MKMFDRVIIVTGTVDNKTGVAGVCRASSDDTDRIVERIRSRVVKLGMQLHVIVPQTQHEFLEAIESKAWCD
jgi:cob(I)alamin adenosyltransferase